MGGLCPTFRGTGEGLRVLTLAVSQVASVQNNHYGIVVHLGQPALGSYIEMSFDFDRN